MRRARRREKWERKGEQEGGKRRCRARRRYVMRGRYRGERKQRYREEEDDEVKGRNGKELVEGEGKSR